MKYLMSKQATEKKMPEMKNLLMSEKEVKANLDKMSLGKIKKPKTTEREGCLGLFKGQRAGAKRAGDNKIMIGYPDALKEGSGHLGAHQN